MGARPRLGGRAPVRRVFSATQEAHVQQDSLGGLEEHTNYLQAPRPLVGVSQVTGSSHLYHLPLWLVLGPYLAQQLQIHYSGGTAKPASATSSSRHAARGYWPVYTYRFVRHDVCMVSLPASLVNLLPELTRRPTAKEAKSLRLRRQQLSAGGVLAESARRATAHTSELRDAGADRDLRLRRDFVFLREPIDSDLVSDRRAPHRSLRPPATQITSSQGATLRFELTLLAIAQGISKPGARGHLPQLPVSGYSSERSWIDVIASTAKVSGGGNQLSIVRDKKARSIRSALETLEGADLVGLRGSAGEQGRYEGFYLLHEGGHQNSSSDPIPYVIPPKLPHDEGPVSLPAGFIEKGWVHVLADSELVLLLMVACGYGGALGPPLEPGEVAVPADIRLRHYGIHRDPFSTARKTLEYFGLLKVNEVDRYHDGRGVDDAQNLHRLTLQRDTFDLDAISSIRDAIDYHLAR